MTAFLLDNSVWARLALGEPRATARLRRIEKSPADMIVTCPPQVLEFCHSARNPQEYVRLRAAIGMGFPLEITPEPELLFEIQHALWHTGLVRAAGPTDILIAGYAIANDATVLSADRDFDHIARVSSLVHEYLPSAPPAP